MLRNSTAENVKNDKDLIDTWIKGRNQPNKKGKQIDDIINIFARLDGYALQPGYLMTSGFVKRAPELNDPDDNVENVSHKVKMLEAVVVNLANKLSEETRILKEDSKAIRSEIKSLKPSFADLFKTRQTGLGNASPVENNHIENRNDVRANKRSRTDDPQARTGTAPATETRDNVFEDDFRTQPKRGFRQNGGLAGRGGEHGRGQSRPDEGDQPAGQGRDRRQSWRQRLPNITGNSGDVGFAAPVDLFVFNVNNEVTEEAIKNHMKDSKGLELLEIVKVSHKDARTKSFKVKIKSEDYDKAMDSQTWPSRVRVRPYRHFKQREQPGGQFGGQAGDNGHGQGGNTSQA